MKPSKIADKIVVGLYKQFLETGQNFSSAEAVVERFPDEAPYLVHTAISMLMTMRYEMSAKNGDGKKCAALLIELREEAKRDIDASS